jgi:hypothetical protein
MGKLISLSEPHTVVQKAETLIYGGKIVAAVASTKPSHYVETILQRTFMSF